MSPPSSCSTRRVPLFFLFPHVSLFYRTYGSSSFLLFCGPLHAFLAIAPAFLRSQPVGIFDIGRESTTTTLLPPFFSPGPRTRLRPRLPPCLLPSFPNFILCTTGTTPRRSLRDLIGLLRLHSYLPHASPRLPSPTHKRTTPDFYALSTLFAYS